MGRYRPESAARQVQAIISAADPLQPFVNMARRKIVMSYIDGFVVAVPIAKKQEYVEHAKLGDSVFMDFGATRVIECWAEVTDFRRAAQAEADEAVVFSWIEWPDKETRDAAMSKMMSDDFNDERMDPNKNPAPFDGKRLIYGGFMPIVEL